MKLANLAVIVLSAVVSAQDDSAKKSEKPKDTSTPASPIASDKKKCMLSMLPEEKPFPSLSFCFRNNVSSCCLTAHDQMMSDSYQGFMPVACQTQFVFFE